MKRLLCLSRRTIRRWLAGWIANVVPPVETRLLLADLEDVLELDEMWSFVGSKAQERYVGGHVRSWPTGLRVGLRWARCNCDGVLS